MSRQAPGPILCSSATETLNFQASHNDWIEIGRLCICFSLIHDQLRRIAKQELIASTFVRPAGPFSLLVIEPSLWTPSLCAEQVYISKQALLIFQFTGARQCAVDNWGPLWVFFVCIAIYEKCASTGDLLSCLQ